MTLAGRHGKKKDGNLTSSEANDASEGVLAEIVSSHIYHKYRSAGAWWNVAVATVSS